MFYGEFNIEKIIDVIQRILQERDQNKEVSVIAKDKTA